MYDCKKWCLANAISRFKVSLYRSNLQEKQKEGIRKK